MKKLNSRHVIVGVALSLMIQLVSPLNPAYSGVVTPPATLCNIEIGDAHISKSLLRTRGLVLTVEIYKDGLLFDHRVAKTEFMVKGIVIQNRVVKNQKTYVKCKNNKWTNYYGIAHGEAIVNGESIKTLRVRSENTERFQCGN